MSHLILGLVCGRCSIGSRLWPRSSSVAWFSILSVEWNPRASYRAPAYSWSLASSSTPFPPSKHILYLRLHRTSRHSLPTPWPCILLCLVYVVLLAEKTFFPFSAWQLQDLASISYSVPFPSLLNVLFCSLFCHHSPYCLLLPRPCHLPAYTFPAAPAARRIKFSIL